MHIPNAPCELAERILMILAFVKVECTLSFFWAPAKVTFYEQLLFKAQTTGHQREQFVITSHNSAEYGMYAMGYFILNNHFLDLSISNFSSKMAHSSQKHNLVCTPLCFPLTSTLGCSWVLSKLLWAGAVGWLTRALWEGIECLNYFASLCNW